MAGGRPAGSAPLLPEQALPLRRPTGVGSSPTRRLWRLGTPIGTQSWGNRWGRGGLPVPRAGPGPAGLTAQGLPGEAGGGWGDSRPDPSAFLLHTQGSGGPRPLPTSTPALSFAVEGVGDPPSLSPETRSVWASWGASRRATVPAKRSPSKANGTFSSRNKSQLQTFRRSFEPRPARDLWGRHGAGGRLREALSLSHAAHCPQGGCTRGPPGSREQGLGCEPVGASRPQPARGFGALPWSQQCLEAGLRSPCPPHRAASPPMARLAGGSGSWLWGTCPPQDCSGARHALGKVPGVAGVPGSLWPLVLRGDTPSAPALQAQQGPPGCRELEI